MQSGVLNACMSYEQWHLRCMYVLVRLCVPVCVLCVCVCWPKNISHTHTWLGNMFLFQLLQAAPAPATEQTKRTYTKTKSVMFLHAPLRNGKTAAAVAAVKAITTTIAKTTNGQTTESAAVAAIKHTKPTKLRAFPLDPRSACLPAACLPVLSAPHTSPLCLLPYPISVLCSKLTSAITLKAKNNNKYGMHHVTSQI